MNFLLIYFKTVQMITEDYEGKLHPSAWDRERARVFIRRPPINPTMQLIAENYFKEAHYKDAHDFFVEFTPILHKLTQLTFLEQDFFQLDEIAQAPILNPLIALLKKYNRTAEKEHEPVLLYFAANPLLGVFATQEFHSKHKKFNSFFQISDYSNIKELTPWETPEFKKAYHASNLKDHANIKYLELNSNESRSLIEKKGERQDEINTHISYFLTYIHYIFLKLKTTGDHHALCLEIISVFQRILNNDRINNTLIFEENPRLFQEKVLFLEHTVSDKNFKTLYQKRKYHDCFYDTDGTSRIIDQTSIEMMKTYEPFNLLLLTNIDLYQLDDDRKALFGKQFQKIIYYPHDLISHAEKVQLTVGTTRYTQLLLFFIEALLRYPERSQERWNILGTSMPRAFKEILAFNDRFNNVPLTCIYVDEITQYRSYEEFVARKLPELMCIADTDSMPLDEAFLLKHYQTLSEDVIAEFLPSEIALKSSIQNMLLIKRYIAELSAKSNAELQDMLKAQVEQYKQNQSGANHIWAILLKLFERNFNFCLNTVQIINTQLIINDAPKIIAQIKTGEGKSALFTVMMAFRFLTTSRKQFFITSADNLAVRDLDKYYKYLEQLNISTSTNLSGRPDQSCYMAPSSFRGDIVYGTPFSFQVAYMYSLNQSNPFLAQLRDVFNFSQIDLFLDEVDSIFVDLESSMSSINCAPPENETTEFQKTYHDIYQFGQKNQSKMPSIESFRAYLIKKGHFTHQSLHESKNLFKTYCWFNSLIQSLTMKANADYVIKEANKKKSLVIVDKEGTGELREKTSWTHGLQQILCAKENITISPETDCSISLRQHNFFKLFQCFFALTGSIGSTQSIFYLQQLYPGLKVQTLPRYKPSLAQEKPHIICDNKSEQHQKLIELIRNIQSKQQSLLILFKTILEVQEFAQFADKNKISVFQLTGLESNTIEDIIGSASAPGNVLVSTFLAGRGADITPSIEVEKKGGLMVCVCNPPANSRVIKQNFGRTGRQGRKGMYQFCFTKADLIETIMVLINLIQSKQPVEKNEDSRVFPWEISKKHPSIAKNSQTLNVQPFSTQELQRNNENVLYDLWMKLLLDHEELVSQHNLRLSSYSGIFFELQQLIFALNRPKVIKKFSENHHMLSGCLEHYLTNGTVEDFKNYLRTMLKDILIHPHFYLEAKQTASQLNLTATLSILEHAQLTEHFQQAESLTDESTLHEESTNLLANIHAFFKSPGKRKATVLDPNEDDTCLKLPPPEIFMAANNDASGMMGPGNTVDPYVHLMHHLTERSTISTEESIHFEKVLEENPHLIGSPSRLHIDNIQTFITYLKENPVDTYVQLFGTARYAIDMIIDAMTFSAPEFCLKRNFINIGFVSLPSRLNKDYYDAFVSLIPLIKESSQSDQAKWQAMPLFIMLVLNHPIFKKIIADAGLSSEQDSALKKLPLQVLKYCLEQLPSPSERISFIKCAGRDWSHIMCCIILEDPDSFGGVLSLFPETPQDQATLNIRYTIESHWRPSTLMAIEREHRENYLADKVAFINSIGLLSYILEKFGIRPDKRNNTIHLLVSILMHFSESDRERILLRDPTLKNRDGLILPSLASPGLSGFEFSANRTGKIINILFYEESFLGFYHLLKNQFTARLELVELWTNNLRSEHTISVGMRAIFAEIYQEIQEKMHSGEFSEKHTHLINAISQFIDHHMDEFSAHDQENIVSVSHASI